MPVQLRSIPRFDSSLHRLLPDYARPSPPPWVRAARSMRGVLMLGLAALAWACGGSAWAQSSATPTEPVSATPPATPPFELKSPWDAPEPWRTDRYYFQFAYYTIHFHYDENHQQSYLFDAEYHFKETFLGGQWIAGMALFQNSFGQFSQYLFGGLLWRPIEEHQPFYVKLSAGPLHGYSGQYQDKVPFNSSGVAPAIIPSMGYCVKRYCAEFVLLGTNAALLTFGMSVP